MCLDVCSFWLVYSRSHNIIAEVTVFELFFALSVCVKFHMCLCIFMLSQCFTVRWGLRCFMANMRIRTNTLIIGHMAPLRSVFVPIVLVLAIVVETESCHFLNIHPQWFYWPPKTIRTLFIPRWISGPDGISWFRCCFSGPLWLLLSGALWHYSLLLFSRFETWLLDMLWGIQFWCYIIWF